MRTRIRLSATIAIAAALGGVATAQRKGAPARCERLYIGTQNEGAGQGIVTASLDTATGQISGLRLAAEAARPTWLLSDRPRGLLYAASDPRATPSVGPQVIAWTVDRTSGDLQPLGATAPGGQGPTHLDLDRRSRTMFVAQYGSGQVSSLPLSASGAPLAPASVVQNAGTGPSPRQTSPHAHAVALDPSGRYLLSPDLGADRVFVYRFDPATRQLMPAATPFAQLPPGTGPRHLVFAPRGRFAYLVSELSADVRTFAWDARTGRLTERQVVPLNPPGFAGTRSAAEIAISPDGRFLYVSNRSDDTIETLAVDVRTGLLDEMARTPVSGKLPWSFALAPDGRWIVVTNQGSDTLTVLPRDPRSGRLSTPVANAATSKPVSVTFAGAVSRCL